MIDLAPQKVGLYFAKVEFFNFKGNLKCSKLGLL